MKKGEIKYEINEKDNTDDKILWYALLYSILLIHDDGYRWSDLILNKYNLKHRDVKKIAIAKQIGSIIVSNWVIITTVGNILQRKWASKTWELFIRIIFPKIR